MEAERQHTPEAPASASNEDENSSTTKPLRRACDCCRKRKVKCDGDNPCSPCKKASIRCAYLQPAKKKGPKGLRSARVLHALRRIDHNASASPTSPLTPEQQHPAFGNWGWNAQRLSPNGTPYTAPIAQQPPDVIYTPHTTVPPDQAYFQHHNMANAIPQAHQQTQYTSQPVQYGTEVHSQGWAAQPNSTPTHSDTMMSPTTSEPTHTRFRGETFLPYMRLFFEHMFPIMPIICRNTYLNPSYYVDSSEFTSDEYAFLCAICAATIVQLDESIVQPPRLHPHKRSDDLFAEECLRERRKYDYIERPTDFDVMTCFFLFAYYGNHEKHAKAWFYLQESITFAENLNMDDESSYAKLDLLVDAQWRRRRYWLLFITERAYAVQRRKHTRLQKSVQLPSVFDSEDPQLLNGFVNLANLFAAVDDNFVKAWRGSRRQSLCNETWLAETQKQLDAAAYALGSTSETQQMDISVTREWLHMLAWQMGVSNGLMWGKSGSGSGTGMRLDYPIDIARKVVEITSGANALALDSHGIGMEQKLSDIAGCLADVLKCIAGDPTSKFLEGKQYLNILLQKLSTMRGKQSRYLQPLMAKMEGLMGYELDNQTLPLPTETPASYPAHLPNLYAQRLSMADSIGMLRSLSMSGALGMPSLTVPLEDWTQRRPSGKVYDEAESVDSIDSWMLTNGVAQAV